MARKISPLLPSTERLLRQLGGRIKLARLRRRLQAKMVAERAGMTVNTLRALEEGNASTTIAAYAAVLQVLGMEKDFNFLMAEDPIGRALQDRIPGGKLSIRRTRSTKSAAAAKAADEAPRDN